MLNNNDSRYPARRFITPHMLAERWHTTTGSLATMRCRGEGPAYTKLGARVLYDLRSVERYEDGGAVDTLNQRAERVSA
ncbi:hypothetical protein Pve01_89960 [Planomonospora venezuelensis]|nr:hypothetical protein Pve01_89960 [Planomonospora venezuelensis]